MFTNLLLSLTWAFFDLQPGYTFSIHFHVCGLEDDVKNRVQVLTPKSRRGSFLSVNLFALNIPKPRKQRKGVVRLMSFGLTAEDVYHVGHASIRKRNTTQLVVLSGFLSEIHCKVCFSVGREISGVGPVDSHLLTLKTKADRCKEVSWSLSDKIRDFNRFQTASQRHLIHLAVDCGSKILGT